MNKEQIEFNRKICKALGIPLDGTISIDIHIESNEVPRITVTSIVTNEDLSDFADVISNYEVVINDPNTDE